MEMLVEAAIFLAAAVTVVPIFQRLGLGSALGYLVAGALIGPAGLRLVTGGESITVVADFGVVLLLFVIGLELQPRRLWTLRTPLFGFGGAQLLVTAVVIALIVGLATRHDTHQNISTPIVIGLALAMSSTSLVLQTLAERGRLGSRHGRAAFAILLFQDLAAIPILAIVPLLGDGASAAAPGGVVFSLLKVAAVIAGVVLGGHYLLRPTLRLVAQTRIRELFTASTLLIVTGTALAMNWIGISMALGAFLAGMLLANSEYRHELEADIDPFKGLFLGLFFISVGMGLDLGLILRRPLMVFSLLAALLTVKAVLVYGTARLMGAMPAVARRLAAVLPQGGEFAFVIFGVAVSAHVLDPRLAGLLTLVVSLSMAATPLTMLAEERLAAWLTPVKTPTYDALPDDQNPVIIAGFGRFGQITGRILAAQRIPFTALDASAEQVDFVKRYGNKVYYGDASRLDLLRAARADAAKVFVLAIDDVEASLRTAEMVRRHFPHLTLLARARNRQHAYRLMDLGVSLIQRETFLSALDVAHQTLLALGLSRARASHVVRTFQAIDEKRLFEYYTYREDQEKLIALTRAGAKELEEMFARDAGEQIAAE